MRIFELGQTGKTGVSGDEKSGSIGAVWGKEGSWGCYLEENGVKILYKVIKIE